MANLTPLAPTPRVGFPEKEGGSGLISLQIAVERSEGSTYPHARLVEAE